MDYQLVKRSEIVFDEDCYPRDQSMDIIGYTYYESMKAGVKFPPIVVAQFEGKFILVDGWHRVEAHRRMKNDYIEVFLFQIVF